MHVGLFLGVMSVHSSPAEKARCLQEEHELEACGRMTSSTTFWLNAPAASLCVRATVSIVRGGNPNRRMHASSMPSHVNSSGGPAALPAVYTLPTPASSFAYLCRKHALVLLNPISCVCGNIHVTCITAFAHGCLPFCLCHSPKRPCAGT
jgi:hypothetical protein